MHGICRLAAITLVTLLPCAGTAAKTTIGVLDTYPAGQAVKLGRNENFYLHLHYESDQPVRIWVKPRFRNEPVGAGTNTSRLYPAGSGEALGWFFLSAPGARVDEVWISAGDGSTDGTSIVETYRVSVSAADGPVPRAEEPAWLGELGRRDEEAQRAAYEQAMNEPMSSADILLFNGFMLAMLATGIFGFVAPALGLRRWRGGWRIAAAVPAAMMGFVVLRLVLGVMIDPSSHNLWPFEILMAGGLSSVIMLVLFLARKLMRVTAA